MRVIIESPFRGRGCWPVCTIRQRQNVQYARKCVLDSLGRGEHPFASHLFYPQVLPETWAERKKGMEAGFDWMQQAELVAFYVDRGVTSGMLEGMRRARELGIKWERRRLK